MILASLSKTHLDSCSFFQVPEGADINKTIPRSYTDDAWKLEQCEMHAYNNVTNTYSNHTVECPNGWYYNPDPIVSTVVSEVR